MKQLFKEKIRNVASIFQLIMAIERV